VEAKEYLRWFLNIKEERIEVLESNVKQIFPKWEADYTNESLVTLYQWFKKLIAYRPISQEEKKSFDNQISKTPLFVGVIPEPETTFTDETVSICFDIGLYFGELLIKDVPLLMWTQKLNSKNYIYYAQPLLSKPKSKVPVNPRASMEGIARRILDKDIKETTFEILYDKWFRKFTIAE
jgi:hypothetical protein